MIHLSRNVDLGPKIKGLETAAANAFDVAFLTANWTAAFSVDSGKKFTAISPYDLLKPLGLSFCCDQGVTYVPRINSFLWVLLGHVDEVIAEADVGIVEGLILAAKTRI